MLTIITYRNYLLIFLFLFLWKPISAQLPGSIQPNVNSDSTIFLAVNFFDNITSEILGGESLQLIDQSTLSILVDSIPAFKMGNLIFYYYNIPRTENGLYTLKGKISGYNAISYDFRIPKRDKGRKVVRWNLSIPLQKEKRDIELGAAIVRASRIKMVVKGDTVVYDADAFQMAEGSLLDDLIKTLPGFRIDDNGIITHNGNFVSELLVNGRHFFQGDPSVALKNLPSYIVNKVHVYHKAPDEAYLQKRDSLSYLNDPLVVDILLKREYAQGWITNLTVGAGNSLYKLPSLKDTEDNSNRYLLKAFGLQYTNQSNLFIFTNLNNINDDSDAGRSGNWSQIRLENGCLETKKFGANYSLNFLNPRFKSMEKIYSSLQITYKNNHQESRQASVSFLPSGNTFGRMLSELDNHHFSLNWQNRYRIPFDKALLKLYYSLYLTRKRENDITRNFTFPEKGVPDWSNLNDLYLSKIGSAYKIIWASELKRRHSSKGQNHNIAVSMDWCEPWFGNNVCLSFDANFERNRTKMWGWNKYYHGNLSSEDIRHEYETRPYDSYNYNASIGYDFTLYATNSYKQFHFDVEYAYIQSYSSDNRSLYRLDRLGGEWLDPTSFTTLPSMRETLEKSLDRGNSFNSGLMHKRHETTLEITNEGTNIKLGLEWSFNQERIVDIRDTKQNCQRHYMLFSPSLYIPIGDLEFNYNARMQAPPVSYLINSIDDSDPFHIYKSGATLHNTLTHSTSLSMKREWGELKHSMGMSMMWNVITNAVSMSRLYNEQTGVSTYTPTNLSGNWGLRTTMNYSQYLDNSQRWFFDNNLTTSYHHSVDYVTYAVGNKQGYQSVDNFNIQNKQKWSFSDKGWNISARLEADWRILRSRHTQNVRMSHIDYCYGVSLATPPIFNTVSLKTDFTVYSRRGYQSSSMNTNDIVWNLSASVPFGKRKDFIFKFETMDLLKELSRVRHTVSSQGTTETWYNTIPAYGLASLTYRLNIQPKKRSIQQ